MKRTIDAYRHSQMFTSTPGDLLLALYDGMLRYCLEAKVAIENKNPAAKGQAINRAYDILTELSATLDPKHNPKLCADLTSLYNYWFEKLQEGSMLMRTEPLEEVIRHIGDMRTTWQQAIVLARKEGLRA
jgi:flagellar protein FliS